MLAPLRLPAPDVGEIAHETPCPDTSLFTVALIGSMLPAWTEAAVGDTETVIATNVMVADPDLELSATEVALTVMVRSLGGGALGAVYVVGVPLGVAVGDTLPHDDALHETVQVTPLPDGSLLTVAVKEADPPAGTELEPAETETAIGGTVIAGELLPPPQPVMIVTEANPRSARAKDAVRFICASASSIFGMRVYNLPCWGR